MIEVTFLICAAFMLIFLRIGIYIRFWTARRLLWFPVVSFMPFDAAGVLQIIIDKKYLLIIPVLILLAVITYAFGFILSADMKREPWRSRYHVDDDSKKKGIEEK